MFGPTPSKNDIKIIKSLNMKKYRDLEGLFVVEGEKMVSEAQSSGADIAAIYRTAEIGEELMKKMTLLSSPSPALAVIRKPKFEEEPVGGLMLALDSVRDPGNMGTILRLADWFGIDRIYASKDCVDIYNPKAIQASMGSIFRKKVNYIDLKKLLQVCRSSSVPVYATTLDGENIHSKKLNKEKALILMGSENNGVSPELLAMVNERLFIPPYPIESLGHTSESLNVAIATAIICYEFRKL